ncbi:MAG: bifunctional sugar-1-phosphate nucleotidylyltransferase/acetyltransferase [Candidatus Hydrothermarchaeaceae archaeon]
MKAVVLVAGRGTRLEPVTSDLPKCMLPLAGKPVLEHILLALKGADVRDIVMLVGYKKESIRDYFGDGVGWDLSIKYLEQRERLGTAHAIGRVKMNEDFLVINGDTLYSADDIKRIAKAHSEVATFGVRRVDDPTHYGVVKVENGHVKEIVEKPKSHISDLVNVGLYAFSPKIFEAIKKTKKSERGEYEITSSIEQLIEEGEKVKAVETVGLFSDIGNPWNYLDSNQVMLEAMEGEVKGEIEEYAKVKGKLCLGESSIVRSGTYIEEPVYIGKNTVVGPNAYLRGYTAIGDNCRVGNAVEIKNSVIMDNTYIPHLSYVGDSIVGRNCNFGAGTLVGNLRLDEKSVKMRIKGELRDTGRRKMGCIVGDNVKTGLNVMINAGRKIGQNSMIGPGVVVYHDVPENSFILEKQVVEEK